MTEKVQCPPVSLPNAVVIIHNGIEADKTQPDAKLLAALPKAVRVLELGPPMQPNRARLLRENPVGGMAEGQPRGSRTLDGERCI